MVISEQRKDLVFVISGGRTGTQFLGNRLSTAISGSFSVHEPDTLSIDLRRAASGIRTFGLWNMTVGKAMGQTGVRSIGQQLITGRIDRSTALSRLRRLRERYHTTISEPLIIESNSQWFYVCDELATIWPDARVIVIIRDPRTWIRSWLNKGIRWRWYDPVRIFPPGRLTPHKVGDSEWAEQWNSFDTLGRLAWEWRFVYGSLLAHVQRNANARLFRFEDLFVSENQSSMHELVAYAASHPSRKYNFEMPDDFRVTVHNASSGSAPDWKKWDRKQARIVHRLCGPVMEELGYGDEYSWKRKLGTG